LLFLFEIALIGVASRRSFSCVISSCGQVVYHLLARRFLYVLFSFARFAKAGSSSRLVPRYCDLNKFSWGSAIWTQGRDLPVGKSCISIRELAIHCDIWSYQVDLDHTGFGEMIGIRRRNGSRYETLKRWSPFRFLEKKTGKMKGQDSISMKLAHLSASHYYVYIVGRSVQQYGRERIFQSFWSKGQGVQWIAVPQAPPISLKYSVYTRARGVSA
jgi:hypothetical protein